MSSTVLGELVIWVPLVGVLGCIGYSLCTAGITHLTSTTSGHNTSVYPIDVKPIVETRSSAFTAKRLTSTTFLVTEYDDIYHEHPFIYVKVVPTANAVLVLDTGCGGASSTPYDVTDLREFIECVQIDDNNGKPLNEGGTMKYVVVLSHCHYDHILGVEQFAKDSLILESGHSPSSVSPNNLPENSLCATLGIRTPSYKASPVSHMWFITAPSRHANEDTIPLGITALHTPGHTPDELALWDDAESVLYVGDTLYEDEPIIFPKAGSITDWFSSVEFLFSFVRMREGASGRKAKICCGHATAGGPASDVLRTAAWFMEDVVLGKEPVKEKKETRGEVMVTYRQEGGKFSLVCPERLVLEARASRSTTYSQSTSTEDLLTMRSIAQL